MSFKNVLIFFFLLIAFQAFSQVKTYDKFSDFEVNYLKNLSEDTVYVVNFWATWCAPCVAELSHFEALNKKYKNKNVKVVLVSLDSPKNLASKVVPFIVKNKINSEVVLLADSKTYKWIDLVDPSWSGAIPITLVFNKGKKYFYEKDYESLEALEKDIFKIKD